ncbi:type I restriction enzyme HsdR N-terminal domain-containing protein [Microbispora sp. H13382]|uniref:type I restriction enzyme HsdR N-terminal domain-containing protein n=1 Tax=Microbispora sp. H13382 TaxID=2729112 RepID=UPI001604664B|nr:type I restriction enzyme HsdR N-terminal domain-containing protein [Microbispora sp. H13382]
MSPTRSLSARPITPPSSYCNPHYSETQCDGEPPCAEAHQRRRHGKPFSDLIARDANEGDTRLLVTDFLCEGLGYDKYEDLTTEYQVKGEFADYGIRVDEQLAAFIEVKRCTQKLGVKHLRQVQMYAVNEGVEWMVLTNGQVWQVYHLTGGLPVVVGLALEVDLLDPDLLA